MITLTKGADMNRRQLLQEMQSRIDTANRNGNWRMAEIYAAAAIRIQQTPDLSVSGLSRRLAAELAPVPMGARLVGDCSGGPEPGDSLHDWNEAEIAAHHKRNGSGPYRVWRGR
jgi:hypothetical protein